MIVLLYDIFVNFEMKQDTFLSTFILTNESNPFIWAALGYLT